MKAVRLLLDESYIKEMIGLDDPTLHIHMAQVNNNHWKSPRLEIIVTGDTLSDVFTVEEGEEIKLGNIVATRTVTEAHIVPILPLRGIDNG